MKSGSLAPFKSPLCRLVEYYQKRLDESRVRYVPNHEVTPSQVMQEGADVVIVAIGAEEYAPDIPGLRESQVLSAGEFYLNESVQREGRGKVAVIGAGSGSPWTKDSQRPLERSS